MNQIFPEVAVTKQAAANAWLEYARVCEDDAKRITTFEAVCCGDDEDLERMIKLYTFLREGVRKDAYKHYFIAAAAHCAALFRTATSAEVVVRE